MRATRARAPRRLVGGVALAAALLAGQSAIAVAAAPAQEQAPAPAPSAPGRLSGPLQSLASGGASANAPAGGAPARSVGPDNPAATGAGTLIDTPDGVLVQVFSSHLTDTVVQGLRDAGARIVNVDKALGIATVSAAADELRAVAAVDGVRYVREVLEPLSGRTDAPAGATTAASAAVVQPSCGAAHSEGDTQLNAVGLRTTYDDEGAGVKVGVLSDTWNQATGDNTTLAQDIASGDIPGAGNPCPGPGRTTPVPVLSEGPSTGATDEGRAMGQVVHDLAPAAGISFASAFNGDTDFGDQIRALKAAGAGVIVDDIFYFNEPAYQNGVIGQAVEDVVAGGAAYFSAIGNETITLGGNPVSSYEAPAFRPMACPAGIPGTCHDFNSGAGTDNTFRVTVPANGLLRQSLKWNEPWNGVATDLNLYYLINGSVAFSSTEDNPNGSQQPFEFISITAGSAPVDVDIVVSRRTGTHTPRFKLEHVRSNITASEYTTSANGDILGPNAVGHAASPGGVGVGAIPYFDSTTPESYSNRGPATWYWGPAVGPGAAAALASPLVLNKPDIAATDGGQTTFFYDRTPPFTSPFRFFGTSEAAPHAAAVAALLRSCNPSLTPAQITTTLRNTAAPVASGDAANVGAGRVDAKAAGDAVCPPPVTGATFSVSNASVAEGNGGSGTTANKLAFTITLSKPLTTAVSVTYASADGTAVAPGDYGAKAATAVTFAKGVTSKTINIAVKGETAFEPDETMSLLLSSPVGATIADGTGVGTIVNDDAPPPTPSATVNDVSIAEGNGGSGSTPMKLVFTVHLSAPAPAALSVQYRTQDGTAVAPGDYGAKALTTLTFAKGQTDKTVTVTIKGDHVVEPNETFTVLLSNPVGATISDGSGTGTILNDD